MAIEHVVHNNKQRNDSILKFMSLSELEAISMVHFFVFGMTGSCVVAIVYSTIRQLPATVAVIWSEEANDYPEKHQNVCISMSSCDMRHELCQTCSYILIGWYCPYMVCAVHPSNGLRLQEVRTRY